VADAVVLDRWDGTDVRLGQVIDRLTQLRNSAARTASRVSVMTLVVVTSGDEEASRAAQALHALGSHHPARLIILRPEPDAPATAVDARVALCATDNAGHRATFDEVALTLKGGAAGHLRAMIEPFTLPDLPVVLWYPGRLPAPTEPLLAAADAVVVDSRETGGDRVFAALSELVRRRVLVDLSWARLRPWRELTAGLFDAPALRPFLDGVTAIEVAGKPGPRRLMAGWLLSRLRTPASLVQLSDGRHVQITIGAEADGVAARFALTRGPGDRVVQASVQVGGGPGHQEMVALPDDSLAWSLARALTHLTRDRVWERAVQAAVILGP
jgi:glucose-6-phosphate dehydrogenase assembly protein OpcA